MTKIKQLKVIEENRMNKEKEMQSVHLLEQVKMPTKIYQMYGWHSNLQEIHFKRILLQSKLLVENNILKTFSNDGFNQWKE